MLAPAFNPSSLEARASRFHEFQVSQDYTVGPCLKNGFNLPLTVYIQTCISFFSNKENLEDYMYGLK